MSLTLFLVLSTVSYGLVILSEIRHQKALADERK